MPPNIFSCPPTTKALVTLILIENSQGMLTVWDDLSQHYLPTLLGEMRMANPVVPIPVLWLTTAPVGDDATSLHSAPPRQYNQLPELKFSFSQENRITSRIINRATELMLEAATQFQGGPVNFHLFILAASEPTQDTWGISLTMPSQIGQSEWRLLGQRIAQLNIHCHMIVPASQDMSSLTELFTTTLELQGRTQVSPWFTTGPEYTILLSGDPSGSSITCLPTKPSDFPFPTQHRSMIDPVEQMGSIHSPVYLADLAQQPLFPATRPPVLRHQSFPQDVQSTSLVAPLPPQSRSMPSLVSSLQKVHGLSRKKLYGTQPPRQPFVRDEPVRTKYKSSPTPLSIPVRPQSFFIHDETHAVSKAKVERGRRVDRLPHIGDLSSSTSPGRRSPWNRVSSSDVGSSPSSPTAALSPHHAASPTLPLYPDLVGYPPVSSASFSSGVVTPVVEASVSGPLSGTYFPIPLSFQSPPVPVPSQGPNWGPVSMPTTIPASVTRSTATRRHSQEVPHGSNMQSLGGMSNKYRLDTISTDARASKSTQKVKDAGDVPFIFSPELEAATAAKLKAALRSTPVLTAFTSKTGLNSAAAEDAYDGSSQTPRPFGYNAMQDGRLGMGGTEREWHRPPCLVESTSSSLQGWAG